MVVCFLPGIFGSRFAPGAWYEALHKPAARSVTAHLERLADTPNLKRIVVAHDRPITDRPAETLRSVAAAL